MNILGLVDLHWSGPGAVPLPDLAGVDLVLLGGDLTHFEGEQVARRIVEQVQRAGPQVLAVCGNCDRPEIEDYLSEAGVALDHQAAVVGGAKFLGLSGGLPFGHCPYERTEAEFAAACRELKSAAKKLAVDGPTILVSHQPPIDTCCDFVRGRHVGSTAIRAVIEDLQPALVLCGHIHEGIGADQIGRSRVINPGPWAAGHYLRFEVQAGLISALQIA